MKLSTRRISTSYTSETFPTLIPFHCPETDDPYHARLLKVEEMGLKAVDDGKTWAPAEVMVAERGYLASWVRGPGENADRDNVRVWMAKDD
jgi:hypothetical protein